MSRQPRKWYGSNWIRREKRLAIYRRDGFRCVYCNADGLEDGVQLTLDHVLAVELGGDNKETNLVSCCAFCNSSKAHLPVRKFVQRASDMGGGTPEVIRRRVRNATRRKLVKERSDG